MKNLIKYLDTIKQNSYRLLRLVNNLIDISRIDIGYYNLIPSNNNIISVIEDITLSVVDYVEDKNINLIFDTDIEIHGSGRTDAGTHAKGQVANFKCETDMSTSELKNIINKYVPKDISVIDCSEVDMRFHSRLNAKSKEYLYIIDNGEIHDPFMKNYAFRVEEKIDNRAYEKGGFIIL